MISGGVAAILYGEPRLTTDIDLVITLPEQVVPDLHALFDSGAFYVPPIEVIHIEARRHAYGHFNIIHHENAFRADIYIAGTDDLSTWGLTRRKLVTIGGQDLFVAPPEYVILSKLQYFRDGGSPKHLSDIRTMLHISNDIIDRTVLAEYVDRLQLQQQWDAVGAAGS